MEWRCEGLIIGVRRHGESGAIVELMTRERGRCAGLVRGGRSRRLQTLLQPGNSVDAAWRARLEEHLGQFTVEPLRSRAGALMESAQALHGLNHMTGLLRLLPERDPHPALYDGAAVIVEHLHDPRVAPALLVRFELALLAELGFGLDLSQCAASGVRDGLAYISPKSGRAVSRAAGAPYGERLLALPLFLTDDCDPDLPSRADVLAGFKLTGFFLGRSIYEPRGLGLPDARAALIAGL